MVDRVPYAMASPILVLARALVHVCEDPEWYNLPVHQAVSLMMKHSGGALRPQKAEEQFRAAVESVGLAPIEEGSE